MSDVTVAPAASPPPTNEVPVDPNPVSTPQPIGPQTPSKSPEEGRRESIQKAFDKAAERPKPEPRKVKMGDNNPPEPMEKEKSKPEKIDLKKRPDDQPRDQGRFAPRERAEDQLPNAANTGQSLPDQQPAYKELPEGTPARDPLPRMTEKAKADWHRTPDTVRLDVHRLHQEYARAYQAFRGDHEAMNTIRPFHQMAQEQGTTLDKALGNYTSMEKLLRSDVLRGLDVIVNNLNLRTQDGQKLGLRDVAWHVLNQSPEQHKLLQNQNAQSAQGQQIGQLHQMVNTLAQGIGQMQYERRFGQTRSALDEYAAKHPRFDELGGLIEREIKLGFDLDTAYRRAELLAGPGTTAAQTRTTTTAQTRTSDRSIHGAPGSANGAGRREAKSATPREAIERAVKRAGNSL